MNHKVKKSHGAAKLLSVLLAVLLCATLPVVAGAQALDETTTVAPETELAQSQAEERAVTAQELSAAKDELVALLPQKTLDENADVIQSANWSDTFCREDVLTAVQMNAQVLQSRKKLETVRAELVRSIEGNGFLTDEQRTYFLSALEENKAELPDDLTDQLFADLRDLTQKSISTEEVSQALTGLTEQTTAVDGLSRLLNEMESWTACEMRIEAVSEFLSGKAGKSAAEEQCRELVSREEALSSSINEYFALSSEEQAGLAESVQAFCRDVETCLVGSVLDNARELDALRSETEQLSGKLMPGYIALGVGVVGLLIAVIAAVLALTKRSEEPALDVTTLASREDAEKLDEQNRMLAARIGDQDEMLHNRIQQQDRQIEALRAEIRKLQRSEAPAPQQKKEQVPAQTVAVQLPVKVCDLNLVYNSYSPGSSFLSRSDSGSEYALYDDNSVEFVNPMPNAMNQLSGWSSGGLFYLFDPEINGQRVGVEEFQQYPGFYRAASTHCRAKVRSLPSGDYVLVEKGTIAMEGM